MKLLANLPVKNIDLLFLKLSKKTLPFSASLQHVKNVDMMLLCDECEIWRLLYSKKKLNRGERRQLELRLDGLSYTCSSSLQELDLPAPLNEIYVRNMKCFDQVGKLYYSAGYEVICIYCAGQVEHGNIDPKSYPQCVHCSSKPLVARK